LGWWPYPAAPCLSTDLRAIKDEEQKYRAVGSRLTNDGVDLESEMGKEKFIGTSLDLSDERGCKERVERTLIMIHRQDEWNP